MAANVQGLAFVAVFENRQPVTEAKFINKNSLFIQLPGVIRRLELKPISDPPRRMRIYSSPRHIAKPNVCVQVSCLCDESRSLDGRSRATFTIKLVVCCVALMGKVVNDATGVSVRADPPRRRSGCEVSIIVTGAKRNDASRRWRDQKC